METFKEHEREEYEHTLGLPPSWDGYTAHDVMTAYSKLVKYELENDNSPERLNMLKNAFDALKSEYPNNSLVMGQFDTVQAEVEEEIKKARDTKSN